MRTKKLSYSEKKGLMEALREKDGKARKTKIRVNVLQ